VSESVRGGCWPRRHPSELRKSVKPAFSSSIRARCCARILSRSFRRRTEADVSGRCCEVAPDEVSRAPCAISADRAHRQSSVVWPVEGDDESLLGHQVRKAVSGDSISPALRVARARCTTSQLRDRLTPHDPAAHSLSPPSPVVDWPYPSLAEPRHTRDVVIVIARRAQECAPYSTGDAASERCVEMRPSTNPRPRTTAPRPATDDNTRKAGERCATRGSVLQHTADPYRECPSAIAATN